MALVTGTSSGGEAKDSNSDDTAAVIAVETASYGSVDLTSSLNRQKTPKRILHFSDGILEEYSSEEEEPQAEQTRQTEALMDPNSMTWLPFLWYYVISMGSKTVSVCDYLGENLAYFFGITSPKYQYEIDEYNWLQKQDSEEKEKEDEEMRGWNAGENDNDSAAETLQPDPGYHPRSDRRERY